jgi:hypothetical protein
MRELFADAFGAKRLPNALQLRETALDAALSDATHLHHILGYAGLMAEQTKLSVVLHRARKLDAELGKLVDEFSIVTFLENVYLGQWDVGVEEEAPSSLPPAALQAVQAATALLRGSCGMQCSVFTDVVAAGLAALSAPGPGVAGGSSSARRVGVRVPTAASHWLCLLASKVFMSVTLDYQRAYDNLRKVISVCGIGSGCFAADLASASDQALLRSEALIMAADLHELTGNMTGSLNYLTEAMVDAGVPTLVLATATDDHAADTADTATVAAPAAVRMEGMEAGIRGLRAAQNVSLSALRLWARLGSDMFPRVLAALCRPPSAKDATAIPQVHAAAVAISALLQGSQQNQALSEREVGSAVGSPLAYRHLDTVWSAVVMRTETDPASGGESEDRSRLAYAMPSRLRKEVREALALSPAQRQSTVTLSGLACASSSCEDLLGTLSGEEHRETRGGLPFDLHRTLRRRAAVEVLESQFKSPSPFPPSLANERHVREIASHFPAFLFAAGSIGTSTECALDSKSTQTSPHADFYASVSSVGNAVMRACCGDDQALVALEARLAQTLIDLRGGGGPSGTGAGTTRIVSVVFDREAGTLLLARADNEVAALTLGLPVGPALRKALDAWDEAMAGNKAQLGATHDVALLATWTDKDKKAWWKARDDTDADMKSIMEQVEALLGPWRFMLGAPSVALRGGGGEGEGEVEVVRTLEDRFTSALDLAGSGSSGEEGGKDADLGHRRQCGSRFPGARLDEAWQRVLDCLGEFAGVAGVHRWVSAVLSACATGASPAAVWQLDESEAVDACASVLKCAFSATSLGGRGDCADGNGGGGEDGGGVSVSELAYALVKGHVADVNFLLAAASGDEDCGHKYSVAAVDDEDEDVRETKEDLHSLKVVELRSRLKAQNLLATGKKDDLVRRLEGSRRLATSEGVGETKGVSGSEGRDEPVIGSAHVVLLLDEALQVMPWECLPCLSHSQCSRMPSLALLLALAARQRPGADSYCRASMPLQPSLGGGMRDPLSSPSSSSSSPSPSPSSPRGSALSLHKCWYAIDPEDNLPGTRKTMDSFLAPFSTRWGWRGVVGHIPKGDTVKSYHEANDLFIYCGHGAGEKLCDAYCLKKYHTPSALLWGCSSGRLVTKGVHDPTGAILSYLFGGAPWAVGNLWDVTDKDIDRLSIECMESIFGTSTGSDKGKGDNGLNPPDAPVPTAEGLKRSRSVCKMAQLVGYAPVMYGLPAGISTGSQ